MTDSYTLIRDSEGGPGTVYRPDGTKLDPSRSQEIKNHSPDGFQWSYSGSGPRQLALAILLDVTDDRELAVNHYRQFTAEVISEIGADEARLSVAEGVEQWLAEHTEYDPQNAGSADFYQHDEWQSGEPCPECGNESMDVLQVSQEVYAHTDGDYEHTDWGAFREDLRVTCKNCQTTLLRHPAVDTLPEV